ncbi:MAG: VenA family class IV lanthipeptide, partial [Pseudonocardiaceae bacterium]
MTMANFDLVSSLHALPETDPIEVDGIQFCDTCGQQCVLASVNVIQT